MGIYCDREPVDVSGRLRREIQQHTTDVWVHCRIHSNEAKKSILPSPLRPADSLSTRQSPTPPSGVVIFHHADTSVVMRDDVPITLALLCGGIIHGTINAWLVDIEEEELW